MVWSACSTMRGTPSGLARELTKFKRRGVPIYVVNIKPMFHEQVVSELNALGIDDVIVAEPRRIYQF